MATQEASDQALLIAAAKGDLAEMQRLVDEEGADPNWKWPNTGNTALHVRAVVPVTRTATWNADADRLGADPLEPARRLLLYGANPLAKNDDGKTARQLAEERGQSDIAALLAAHETPEGFARLKTEESNKALLIAAAKGDLAEIRRLVEGEGADPKYKDHYGYTALHLAAMRGHTETCRLLVLMGGVDVVWTSVRRRPDERSTARQLAEEYSEHETAALLAELEAEAEAAAAAKAKQEAEEAEEAAAKMQLAAVAEAAGRHAGSLTDALLLQVLASLQALHERVDRVESRQLERD